MKFLILTLLIFTNISVEAKLPPRNDTEQIISYMTPVKSQKSRGTCTIFSTTGLFEALLIKKGWAKHDIDLSEEWMEYLAMTRQTDEGCTHPVVAQPLRPNTDDTCPKRLVTYANQLK